MGIWEKIAYDLIETGIKKFGGNYNYLLTVYKASKSNHISGIHPDLRITIPTFQQILDYLLKNGYVQKQENIFKVTNKGEDFLKEQREIRYKKEQNLILKNQLEINKKQVNFNKLLVIATSLLAFDVIHRIYIQPNWNNQAGLVPLIMNILAIVFFILLCFFIKFIFDVLTK